MRKKIKFFMQAIKNGNVVEFSILAEDFVFVAEYSHWALRGVSEGGLIKLDNFYVMGYDLIWCSFDFGDVVIRSWS